jgi:Protein of unknown function (DUF3040)
MPSIHGYADQTYGHAMGRPAVSLSAWEQQALDSIKDELAGSDPGLAALLTTFTRLASSEAMPVRERIRPGSQRGFRSRRHRCQASACPPPARKHRRMEVRWSVLLLCLLVTAGMITAALVLSHGGKPVTGSCTGSWPTICAYSAPG